MDNNELNKMKFEDISSSSPSTVKKTVRQAGEFAANTARTAKKVADNYGEKGLKNVDKVIKVIAYVVSIGFFLIFLAGAGLVYFFDNTLIFLSALILVFGTVISLIFLYLIYGLGEVIAQNKEILRRLRR